MKSEHTGIKRIIKAFSYSYDGFLASIKTEAAFRQDLVFCAVFGLIAIFLPISLIEKLGLIFPLILIILTELINTAIEAVIDRVSSEYHPLSKKGKDIGSLIVLIAFINFLIFWAVILINRFF